MKTQVTIVWRDAEKEPLKADVESVDTDNGFVALVLPTDCLPPGGKNKVLLFPHDRVESVEILEYEPVEREGYREDSTFREEPGKSRWFEGMGQAHERTE